VLLAVLIGCVAWLLYARTLTADFVWDARAKVLLSDFIHNPANLPDVLTGRVITRDVLDYNRPSNLLSLMIDAAFWGKQPVGYHLTSITLHAAICAMLFLLMARLLPPGGTWPAFVAALVYAVHPLNCESVSEVSYREDLLVAAAMLIALFAAMAFLKKPGLWRNLPLGAICCVALLFGVGAKENGAAGPVALTCYWLLWRRKEARLPWVCLVGVASLLVYGFLVARFTLKPQHSAIFTEQPMRIGNSIGETLLIQVRIWTMEFSQIIVPHGLCADYTGYSLRNYSVWASMLVVALVVAGQVFLAFRSRLFAFGWIIFWAGLLPVSNLVPIFRPIADRFLYVPLTGAAIALAQGLFLAGKLRPQLRTAIYGVTMIWACVAAIVTFNRESVWHDSLTLWEDTGATNPTSFDAADNLGWALFDLGRNRDAAVSFVRTIQLSRGTVADPWAGLALALEAAGQPIDADQQFKRAVALDARYAHPDQLLRALIIEPADAGKLEVLARRNRNP
jgi:hypothetical protein